MNKLIQAAVMGMALTLGLNVVANAATPANTETTGQYVSSSAVTAKVKASLLQQPGLSSTDIKVKTHKNTVYLNGVVATEAESQLAEKTAASVSGVYKVENHLVVQNS